MSSEQLISTGLFINCPIFEIIFKHSYFCGFRSINDVCDNSVPLFMSYCFPKFKLINYFLKLDTDQSLQKDVFDYEVNINNS